MKKQATHEQGNTVLNVWEPSEVKVPQECHMAVLLAYILCC